MGAVEHVSREELARRFGVEVRTVTNWVHDKTFPSRVRGKGRDFPWERCLRWYVDREIEKAKPAEVATETASRARKYAADAEIAELNLAERRGELIPMAVHESRVEQLARRLFATVTGQTLPLLMGLFPELPALDAQQKAEQLGDELIAACRASADEIDEAADAGELEEVEIAQ